MTSQPDELKKGNAFKYKPNLSLQESVDDMFGKTVQASRGSASTSNKLNLNKSGLV